MFNCISTSVSPSPSSTPNTQLSCEETLSAFTEDSSLRDDIRNLRIEVQTLREQNEGHHSMVILKTSDIFKLCAHYIFRYSESKVSVVHRLRYFHSST